jgi:hypothetical protein
MIVVSLNSSDDLIGVDAYKMGFFCVPCSTTGCRHVLMGVYMSLYAYT